MNHQTPAYQKEFVIKRRAYFFEEILAKLVMPPGKIDAVMGQKQHEISAAQELVKDPEMGNLLIQIDVHDHQILYSIYQIGKILRIGILLDENVAADVDKLDFKNIWGENEVSISKRGDKNLIEWMFVEDNLLGSWVAQEGYILGIRHMHFRVLTILNEAWAFIGTK